jgi:hypothetical protein
VDGQLSKRQQAHGRLLNARRGTGRAFRESGETTGPADHGPNRGGNASKISQATSERTKGDQDAAADKPDKAIEHYRNAWKYAIGA